ncbi:hypothetical protein [Spirillospora sp. CA-128828]|uniref:hypothetical protein n=1 Tax=Spirillospora sp. CA-128828 TaxID=3240033 RepID=UPI003D950257
MSVDLDKDFDDDPAAEDSPGAELEVVDETADQLPPAARRHIGYTVTGVSVLVRHLWDSRTLAPVRADAARSRGRQGP